jgi:hypothetical protein
MVQGFLSLDGRLVADLDVFLYLGLPDVLTQRLGAQAQLE